jgi:excisionase family DNA binding protein
MMIRLMTTEEAAEFLNKSPWWIRENIGILGIPAVKLGRQWRFKREELERWLELNRAA